MWQQAGLIEKLTFNLKRAIQLCVQTRFLETDHDSHKPFDRSQNLAAGAILFSTF